MTCVRRKGVCYGWNLTTVVLTISLLSFLLTDLSKFASIRIPQLIVCASGVDHLDTGIVYSNDEFRQSGLLTFAPTRPFTSTSPSHTSTSSIPSDSSYSTHSPSRSHPSIELGIGRLEWAETLPMRRKERNNPLHSYKYESKQELRQSRQLLHTKENDAMKMDETILPHHLFDFNFFHSLSEATSASNFKSSSSSFSSFQSISTFGRSVHRLFSTSASHTRRASRTATDGVDSSRNESELVLHIPNRATWMRMQSLIQSSRIEFEEEFRHLYSNSSTHATNPSATLDPLSSHPTFHYQWLVHLKSPINAGKVDMVNRLIAPYQLQHYMPHNSYLVSLPYSIALKLVEGETITESDGRKSSRTGPILFVCMYHPDMKLQSNMIQLLQRRFTDKLSRRRRVRSLNTDSNGKVNPLDWSSFLSHLSPPPISHQLRLTFTYPLLPSPVLHAQFFPLNSRDRIRTNEFVRMMSKEWNQHPAFVEEMSRGQSRIDVVTNEDIQFIPLDSRQIIIKLPASIDLESIFLKLFIRALSHHPSVQYIESHSAHSISNKHARFVLQSDLEHSLECTSDAFTRGDMVGNTDATDHFASYRAPFYTLLGLFGQDQILTIGDTGVDYDSCFFYDPSHTVPINPTSPQPHRKIIAYMTVHLSNSPDSPRADPGDFEGHGTHTAGSLAGEVEPRGENGFILDYETMTQLSNYNGISSKSKLVVFDFQNEAGDLFVPPDVYHDYLSISYNFGSRISSNSWGDDFGRYDSYARDVESFLYDHPDYLMVMAAGNLGDHGLHSVASPAVAKNILTVGATMNGVCSFYDRGLATGIEIVAPTTVAGTHPVTPASFGIPYHQFTPTKSTGACYAQPPLACASLTNAADCHGKIVFVDRGECSFGTKAQMVEAAGGIMMAYLHNDEAPNFIMDSTDSWTINIPAITIPLFLGNQLRPILQSTQISELSFNFPTYFASILQSEHGLSDFSSKGPTLDGRLKPDILAPGEVIESARSDNDLNSFQCKQSSGPIGADGKHTFIKKASIASQQGTSMACPLAAGTASLVREYFTSGQYVQPTTLTSTPFIPSSALIKAVLISGTSPIGGKTPIPDFVTRKVVYVDVEPPPSYHQGHGRVELSEVLSYDIPSHIDVDGHIEQVTPNGRNERSKYQLYVEDNVRISTGEIHKYCFRVVNSSVDLKATLVWTDPPPVLPANLLLVNNLDLMVIGYNVTEANEHKVYIGNERLQSSQSHQLHFDLNNNVEKVIISSPIVGSVYSVIVRGSHVPVSGPYSARGQGYALVVNGDFTVLPRAACPNDIYCPNHCSGRGRCEIHSTPSNELGSQDRSPVEGVCLCEIGWAGADCSIQAETIVPTGSRSGSKQFRIEPDQWTYVYYVVQSGDDSLLFNLRTLTGAGAPPGDPDFYWVTPSRRMNSQYRTYPTLDHYDFVNLECDSCGRSNHTQQITSQYLYQSDDTKHQGGGVVMMGIFGYCCVPAIVEVNLTIQ